VDLFLKHLINWDFVEKNLQNKKIFKEIAEAFWGFNYSISFYKNFMLRLDKPMKKSNVQTHRR